MISIIILQMILPPIIIVVGALGNILTILVYSRKSFSKLSTKNTWRILATVEIFNVLQLTKHFAKNTFAFNINKVSNFTCKLFVYFSYFNSIPAWLLTYLSIERFLMIRSFHRLHKISIKYQTLIITFCIFWDLVIFSPILILYYVDYENKTTCRIIKGYESFDIFFYCFDTFNSTILPFLIMFLCYLFLIRSVFKSRQKMTRFARETTASFSNHKHRRDIQFSTTLILSNFLFFILNFPIILKLIFNPLDSDSLLYHFLGDLYYISYTVNFFIYLITNSNFRREFLQMARLSSNNHKTDIYRINVGV